MATSALHGLGVVVIGRNEGERLARCLASVRNVSNRVYVDSGSSDGSVALALAEGESVIELTEPPPFTAARARNAGIARVLTNDPATEFIQVVDGDCEVQPGWIDSALAALRAEPRLASVFGRRRERYPELSIYNTLCNYEWDEPLGEAPIMGGDALLRVTALREVNCYSADMIAGEDPDLAIRLRKCGWRVRRIDAEMTLHDAAILRFGQWWRRARRAGHAYGELAHRHPDIRAPNCQHSVRSILFWGGVTPLLLLAAAASAVIVDARFSIGVALVLALWPLNMLRLAVLERLRGLSVRTAVASGILLLLGKLPQFLGLVSYYRNRLLGRTSRLMEYKRRVLP